MRFGAAAALLVLVSHSAAAQHFHHHAGPQSGAAAAQQFRRSPCNKHYTTPKLDPALQKVVWNVTGSPTARSYFSQGLTLYYGFNFEEAARSFRAALESDPSMAMAAWGVALASGPNINIDMQGECGQQALQFSRLAVDLAKKQPGITQLERDLAGALAVRYTEAATDSVAYAVAMRRIWQGAKPDPNVAALYAESMLDLRPWALFDNAYRPALDTAEILDVVRTALKADSKAVGVNHLLIHAVEAGPDPREAFGAANLLRTLVPASGHLVHMPSHIFLLAGDYVAAMESNSQALAVDLGQYQTVCANKFEDYWKNPDCPVVYFGHYVGHNHFFRSVAAAFAGRSEAAVQSARDTATHVARFVVNEPGLQRYMTAPQMMLVAHQRWEAIKAMDPVPAGCFRQPPYLEDTGCHILRSMWHWAHGMRHASEGRVREARSESESMNAQTGMIVPPTPTGWGNNTAAAVLAVPTEILLARITWAEQQPDYAIEHLKLAVSHEDALTYDEPPQWFPPARESLGGAYLRTKAWAKARDTFDEALRRHPRSGRALYGLMRALRELGETTRAAAVEKEFREVWKGTDYEMTDARLW